MTAILISFYFLLLASFTCLYVLYYMKVQTSPGFSYTSAKDMRKGDVLAVIVLTGFLLAAYYLLYLIALFVNFLHLLKQDIATKILFATS